MTCLSDLALDRHLAGEGDAGAVEAHLAACAACRARHATLAADAAAFRREAPIPRLAAAARRRARPRRFALLAGAGLALSAAAALLLLALPPSPEPDGRKKGDLALEVFRRGADGAVEALLPGARVSPHDAIRFRVSSARAGWLAVLSIDGAGQVSAYAPPAGPLVPVHAGAGQLLDGATELDATPGRERLIALRCDAPGDTAALVARLRTALGAAAGDAARVDPGRLGCAATSFWIEKAPPR